MSEKSDSTERYEELERRADREQELAGEAEPGEDRLAHERRAEKADYLRRQVERQIESEDGEST